MGREMERSPAEESMRIVIYYCYHIMGAVAVLGTIVLVLWFSFGLHSGGHVCPLIEFLDENKRRRIAGQDVNDCPVIDGESMHKPIIQNESRHRTESQADSWILDSGAQCHATGKLWLFSGEIHWTKQGSWIYGVSGQEHPLPIRGFGKVQFPNFTLEEVYYVDGLDSNLICLSKFIETFGYSIRFGKSAYIEEEATGKRICEIRTRNGFYELDSVAVPLDHTPAVAEGHA